MSRKEELGRKIEQLEDDVRCAESAYDEALDALYKAENELLELEKLGA